MLLVKLYLISSISIGFSYVCSSQNIPTTHQDCEFDDSKVDIVGVQHAFEHNPLDIMDYNLSVTVSLDVKSNEFEGHLYMLRQMVTHGVHSHGVAPNSNMADGFEASNYDYYDSDYYGSFNTCDGVADKLWIHIKNNLYTECMLPCNHVKSCVSDKICRHIKDEKYKIIKKGITNITLPISFAHRYDFSLLQYTKNATSEVASVTIEPIFCLEELTNHGINLTIAKMFCASQQNWTAEVIGRPLNLNVDEVYDDFSNHKAVAILSWNPPLDIKPSVAIVGFAVNSAHGTVDKTLIYAWDTCFNTSNTYCTTIRGLEFNKHAIAHVTVRYKSDAVHSGNKAVIKFFVNDTDACDVDKPGGSYCSLNASCVDNESRDPQPATCVCDIGLHGDGINEKWGGSGCSVLDKCDNLTCGAFEICTTFHLQQAKCVCKNGYHKIGHTCFELAIPLAIGIAIPVMLLLVLFVHGMLRRIRAAHKKKLYELTSKFVVNEINCEHGIRNDGRRMISPLSSSSVGEYEIDENSILMGDIIGRGYFGTVSQGVLVSEGRDIAVAVKAVTNDVYLREFLGEIFLMTSLGHHENVIHVYGYCVAPGGKTSLVMEHMQYGDLLSFLWKARDCDGGIWGVTQRDVLHISRQIANGMAFLKRMKIIHGDLATRNVLVGDDLCCKISDFGLANDVYRYGAIKDSVEKQVPYKWISPERMLLNGEPITWRSDVWSFGVVMYEIYTLGGTPYAGVSKSNLLKYLESGCRLQQPPSCNDTIYSIMKSCWEWQQSKRPSFTSLKQMLDPDQVPNEVNMLIKESFRKFWEVETQQEEERLPVEQTQNNGDLLSVDVG